ncbi:hypothetical protein SAMN04487941_3378 [Pontibacter akesuensis]|uniref:Uncharacterized protein n=1 Tax=Pontibacter akesuensis TaxID=388950 RepID=A0A1I7K4C5_9BACT|nr:hypothetical protein SAMN04487941_3378 [Pontibacter akesuensis]
MLFSPPAGECPVLILSRNRPYFKPPKSVVVTIGLKIGSHWRKPLTLILLLWHDVTLQMKKISGITTENPACLDWVFCILYTL